MPRYRQRPPEPPTVDAQLLTSNEADRPAILEWMQSYGYTGTWDEGSPPDDDNPEGKLPGIVWTASDDTPSRASANEWIVYEGGELSSYSAEEFQQQYELA